MLPSMPLHEASSYQLPLAGAPGGVVGSGTVRTDGPEGRPRTLDTGLVDLSTREEVTSQDVAALAVGIEVDHRCFRLGLGE
jgi:hypothetical protein